MTANRPRYNTIVATGLVLFALSLPLSKSAGNILLFLIYLFVIAGVLLYRDVKEAVVSSIKQPLTPAFFFIYLVALAGVFLSEKYADGLKATNLFLSLPAIYLMVSVLIDAVPDGDKRYRFAESLLAAFLIGLLFLNLIGVLTYLGIVGDKKFVLPLAPMHLHWIWFSNINALGLYTAAAFLLYSRRALTTGVKWLLFLFYSACRSLYSSVHVPHCMVRHHVDVGNHGLSHEQELEGFPDNRSGNCCGLHCSLPHHSIC